MTQQEIFQNMTKGEWTLNDQNPSSFFIASKMNGAVCNLPSAFGVPNENGKREARATAESICNAVNNTYGKGINPESVEVYEAIVKEVPTLMNLLNTANLDELLDRLDALSKRAEEALTAAKL